MRFRSMPILPPVCLILLILFLLLGNFSPQEIGLVPIGLVALWLPLGALIHVLVRQQFPDSLARWTFCAIASYGLTTLVFFTVAVIDLSVPGFLVVFEVLLITALVVAVVSMVRLGLLSRDCLRSTLAQIDWVVVFLVLLSILANFKYKKIFQPTTDETGWQLLANGDQTYYAAIMAELGRGTPPRQQPFRAGVPERAYHVFPHVTSMLVARYTFQPDLMRAHLFYEYAVLDALLVLAVISLTQSLAGSRFAGYLSGTLLFILAIPTPPLMIPNPNVYFYFTWWPHASSSVEPTLHTSPQMFSGVVVCFGVFLGVMEICRSVRPGSQLSLTVLVLTSLLVGAMIRFRLNIFLALFPAWCLLLVFLAWKRRTLALFWLIALSGFVGGILFLEMKSSVYLPTTSSLVFGNCYLRQIPLVASNWPGWQAVEPIASFLFRSESSGHDWVCQILTILGFTLFNVVGIPLLLMSGFLLFLRSLPNGSHLFLSFLFWMVLGSLAVGCCLTATYDNWSVGGQTLLLPGWYLIPCAGVFLGWLLQHWIPGWIHTNRLGWTTLGLTLVITGFLYQMVRPPSRLLQRTQRENHPLSEDHLKAFVWMRENLPEDAVILTPLSFGDHKALIGGIGCRRAYLEYFVGIELIADPRDSNQNRIETISRLWSVSEPKTFRKALPPFITHLMIPTNLPPRVGPQGILKKVWTSPNHLASIWEVIPASR